MHTHHHQLHHHIHRNTKGEVGVKKTADCHSALFGNERFKFSGQ
jgi:hypothetical protein